MKRAELLAPVGKMENAIAAIENGADALFVGGKAFNARQSADNFTPDELKDIIHYAKLRGVRVYVTVNILIKEKEMQLLFDYLRYLEEVGVDALIIQDLGVAKVVRKYFPNLRMHASTQLSAHSIEDVLYLKQLGFKRVVLARELQLKEIREIIEKCDIEVETFVHGALCYSYSGQCLMSSLIGGRSGNRGRCAQPCRMKYTLKKDGMPVRKDAYLLSLKDICSIEFLPELIACGIHSFKIEGRMKSPEYVASVISTYRKYIDLESAKEEYVVHEGDIELLKGIFNRGGFSKGYYYEKGSPKMLTPISPRHIGLYAGEVIHFSPKTGLATIKLERTLHPGDGLEIIREGKESVGTGITKLCEAGSQIKCHFDKYIEVGSHVYLTKNHQLLKEMRLTYQKQDRKLPISLSVTGKIQKPIVLTATYQNISVICQGECLEEATNNPVTRQQALKQLTKLGSTSFVAEKAQIDEWPERGYIGIKSLNTIRREVVEALEKALLKVEVAKDKKVYQSEKPASFHQPCVICHATTLQQLEAALDCKEITTIYWEWDYDDASTWEALSLCSVRNISFYLHLPFIMRNESYNQYGPMIRRWANEPIAGYVIRSFGEYQLVKDLDRVIVTDYNMNVTNNEAIRLWQEGGVQRVTVSAELVGEELDDLQGDTEKIIYGYLPMMTSSQCVLRNTDNCQKGSKSTHQFCLEDRKGAAWRIQTDCHACMMQILSYEPLVMKSGQVQKLRKTYSVRLQFTNETKEEVKDILGAYFEEAYCKLPKGTDFKVVL